MRYENNGFKEAAMDRKYFANLIFSICLGLLVIFALTKMSSALTPKGLLVKDSHPSSTAKSMSSDVFLTKYTIEKELNQRVKATFFVRNSGKQDVKNVHILCEFYAQDGTFLDRKKWFLGAEFPAGKETSVAPPQERYVNVGATVNCSIDDLQIAQAPTFVLHRPAGGGHGDGHGDEHGAADDHHPKASAH